MSLFNIWVICMAALCGWAAGTLLGNILFCLYLRMKHWMEESKRLD